MAHGTQSFRAPILKMGVGQDEKAAVVGDELKALILREPGVSR